MNLKPLLLFVPLWVALAALGSFVSGGEHGKGLPPSSSPTTPSAYEKAVRLLETGKAAEALAEIDAALREHPRDPRLHNLRGLAEGRLGREKEAESSFRKVIELSPRAAVGYDNLAVLLSESRRHAEAAKLFREALKREPKNFTALLGLGETLAALQEYAQAAPYLEEAWHIRRGDFQAGYEWARVLRELKRFSQAQNVLGQLAIPRETALAAKYFALAAAVAEDQGDRAAAARHYRRAYELVPDSFEIYLALVGASLGANARGSSRLLPAAPPSLSAEQHFKLGLLFASQGADAEAVPHFEDTLRMEPSSYSTAYNLALAYQGAGKTQPAMDLIERTLKKKPTAELHNLLASLEETAGQYVNAVRHYRAAVEMEPTKEEYYYDLGAEYLAHFNFEPALEVFRVGTRKFPGSSRQYVGLGFACHTLRQYPEAADAFLTALELDSSSPSAYAGWNSLPSFQGPAEWNRVLPRLRRLADLHPETAEMLYCYGRTLYRFSVAAAKPENAHLAQTLLEQAVRLNPDFADAHLELGNLYASQKENEKALAEFLEAARLNPGSEMAHYRLGQIYRDLDQLDLAEKELARYAQLSRSRREQLARSRSAIKQFILAQSSSSTASRQHQTPTTTPSP